MRKAIREGEFNPEDSDGCTFIGLVFSHLTDEPHLPFKECCVEHDRAYWYGGKESLRKKADEQMRKCVMKQGYPVLAWIMWAFVHFLSGPKIFGVFNNPLPWAWATKVEIRHSTN